MPRSTRPSTATSARPGSFAGLVRYVLALVGLVIAIAAGAPQDAHAVKPIVVTPEQERIEITSLGEFYEGRGDSLQVETAAGLDGASGRMAVRAATAGTNPNWIVFALRNGSDKPIERLLAADRYTVVGSGAIWPDLDARRIEAVTPSLGFVPERIKSDRADVFRVTLEPGQTITYVAELSSERFARIFIWKPLEYELKVRERQLFNGVMLGLTGLLAVFLTAVFAANHKVIFPAAALVAWCVLAYLCVDFGFFHKLFNLRPEDNAVYRAAGEAAMAASLVMFLFVFLRLTLAHGFVRMLAGVWILVQLALVAVAVIDPRLAATFARVSFAVTGLIGALLTLFLAVRGQDRALSLIPTWLLFLVWVFGAAMTLTGRLGGDVVVSGLAAGLVLIVVLIGFTVTQFAFRSLEPVYASAPSDLQLRALAVEGSSSAVWEWNAKRDELKVGNIVEAALGLNSGELSTKVEDFANHLHPADRERFRLMLWSVQERSGGKIQLDFRMRHADNTYRWYELEAASLPESDRRELRCVGLMRDVTNSRRAQERLMHDAVHCALTGLPNRELFLDRLEVAINRAKSEERIRPTLLFIDIDKFKSANTSFGLVVGDSLLLTTSRRLQRHLGPQDTLARVGGDQFAILLVAEQDPRELAALAERIRRSLRAPIKIAGQEIVLTGSLGIAVYDGEEASHHDFLKEAEIAMYRAKRGGADRIELFRPEMRSERDDRITIESDLRKALEKQQLKVLYQPIIYLPTEELAGFEALVRWEHPKLGVMNPSTFVPVAEESDLVVKLGSYVLSRSAIEAAKWQRELPRPDAPLFVSVNVSTRQLFRPDLVQEVRHILGRAVIPKGSLRLEITESLVMENPEQATEMLSQLKGAGAELALDDFGTGYSSLAYLQQFPFDTIKIDKALVQASGSGEGAGAAIVRSMVALAHELGKKVVAEGVESQQDVVFLRQTGCQFAQGFYYGEPLTEKEVHQLLKVVRKSERKLQRRGFFRTKAKEVPAAEIAPASTPADGTPQPAAGSPESDAKPGTDKRKTDGKATDKLAAVLRNPVLKTRARATAEPEPPKAKVTAPPPTPRPAPAAPVATPPPAVMPVAPAAIMPATAPRPLPAGPAVSMPPPPSATPPAAPPASAWAAMAMGHPMPPLPASPAGMGPPPPPPAPAPQFLAEPSPLHTPNVPGTPAPPVPQQLATQPAPVMSAPPPRMDGFDGYPAAPAPASPYRAEPAPPAAPVTATATPASLPSTPAIPAELSPPHLGDDEPAPSSLAAMLSSLPPVPEIPAAPAPMHMPPAAPPSQPAPAPQPAATSSDPTTRPPPYRGLPPAIAASLAKLAGAPARKPAAPADPADDAQPAATTAGDARKTISRG